MIERTALRNMKKFIYSSIIIICCYSCFEEDEMVTPHDPGDLTVDSVVMTNNYKYQVFYDLETDSSISTNLVTDWDLGFESSDSGWHVILNTSKMMMAGNTYNTHFNEVTGNEDIDMLFDPSFTFADSTAISEWYSISDDVPESHLYTYIIDRGTDADGRSIGYKKIIFDVTSSDAYAIRFANTDGTEEVYDTVIKDSEKNFVCYSFDDGIVNIEPNKDDWDLLFTKYSTMLDYNGEPYPYLLTGVLLNPNSVKANLVSDYSFDDISFEYIEDYQLSTQKDIIGYDWKTYDFTNERYSIEPNKNYIIEDNTGYYYKLRFIDFYNYQGAKGYPTFEFIRL